MPSKTPKRRIHSGMRPDPAQNSAKAYVYLGMLQAFTGSGLFPLHFLKHPPGILGGQFTEGIKAFPAVLVHVMGACQIAACVNMRADLGP